MNDLECPHCRGTVPHGAFVCRGCKAEIEYGVPLFGYVVVLGAGIIAGVKTTTIVPDSLSFLGWVSFVGVVVGGVVLLSKVFGDRVVFKRIYRTQ